MRDWLLRAALRLVPASWRASVATDIAEDARLQGQGPFWSSVQAIRIGVALWWTFSRDALLTDLRHVLRSLWRAKGFTSAAMLTFALGIGVNIAVFCALDRVLFRPLPYADPDSLVLLRYCDQKTGECTAGSFPSAVAYSLEQGSSTLQGVAVAGFLRQVSETRDASSDDAILLVDVSPRALRVLGVAPVLGRDITDDEIAARAPVAWLGYDVWRSRFALDRNVLGRVLWSRDTPVTVIGVLPAGFIPPAWSSMRTDWAGLVTDWGGWSSIKPTGGVLAPFARMKPGVRVEDVQRELMTVRQQVTAAAGGKSDGRDYLRADPIQSNLFSRFLNYLWLVEAAAGLVLLMACANLVNLLIVRGRSRAHVAAISTALGASRTRVLLTSMLESLVICLGGCTLALVAVALTETALAGVLPPIFSRYATSAMDGRVLGVSLGAACAAALVAGVWPGWRMTRFAGPAALRGDGVSSARVRPLRGTRALMVVEAALGCVLVLGSVLAVRSFGHLVDDPLGFTPDGLSLVQVGDRAQLPFAQQRVRMDGLFDAVRQMPGVLSAAAADSIPLTGETAAHGFSRGPIRGALIQVTQHYFATMGTPFVAGRDFTESELAATGPVVVLNYSAARVLFPDDPPAHLIRRIVQLDSGAPREIVGVVQDFKESYGGRPSAPAAFVPAGAHDSPWGAFAVRAVDGAPVSAATIRAVLRSRLGDVPVRVTSLADALDVSLRDSRFRAVLLSVLALTGLCVAVVGLFATASYDVTLRMHEMGVRLTLGATPRALQRLILLQACWPVVLGAAAGLTGAYWLAQFATSFLFNITGRDPLTYAAVAGVMVVTALLAAWFPARRAAATDPVVVLKAQ